MSKNVSQAIREALNESNAVDERYWIKKGNICT